MMMVDLTRPHDLDQRTNLLTEIKQIKKLSHLPVERGPQHDARRAVADAQHVHDVARALHAERQVVAVDVGAMERRQHRRYGGKRLFTATAPGSTRTTDSRSMGRSMTTFQSH